MEELAARHVLKKACSHSIIDSVEHCEMWAHNTNFTRTEIQANYHEQVTQQFPVSTGDFEISEQSVEDIDNPDCDSMESLQAKATALSLLLSEPQARYKN